MAALFQSCGYFVEKNVQEAGALELDVVATHPDPAVDSPVLVEAKSGGWGHSDAFKVLGWMRYLNFRHGGFFASGADPAKLASCQQKLQPHGLRFTHLSDFSQAPSLFAASGYPTIADPRRLGLWRYSYLIERNTIRGLRALRSSNPGRAGLQAAVGYYSLVNDGVFFSSTPQESVTALYAAYRSHPKLSLGFAREVDGGQYDADTPDAGNARVREAYLYGQHPEIQASFYLEHRARLAILKAAADFVSVEPSTAAARAAALAAGVPQTFTAGVSWLQQCPSFRRYPLLWQVFLWGFGGFVLGDQRSREHQFLAEHSGVPVDEIPAALEAFDRFFPLPQGQWRAAAGPTNAETVAMVPHAFRGLGVNARRWFFGPEFSGHYADMTRRDLNRWNNFLYDLLMRPQP